MRLRLIIWWEIEQPPLRRQLQIPSTNLWHSSPIQYPKNIPAGDTDNASFSLKLHFDMSLPMGQPGSAQAAETNMEMRRQAQRDTALARRTQFAESYPFAGEGAAAA